MLLSVQPFKLDSAGGGPKIVRELLNDPPMKVHSLAITNESGSNNANETLIPSRPSLGRLERSRFARLGDRLGVLLQSRLEKSIRQQAELKGATAMHLVAHDHTFVAALNVAEAMGLPLFLSVHDDIGYSLQSSPALAHGLSNMGRAWQAAKARYMISDEIGAEYSSRYGARESVMVTDGLTGFGTPRSFSNDNSLTIYFMGLMHNSYHPNFENLCIGVRRFVEQTSINVKVKIRCGRTDLPFSTHGCDVEAIAFGSTEEANADLAQADLLYLPLPFAKSASNFVRFSLSTKLISYLGSGAPILYHGPDYAAAGNLLKSREAAFILPEANPEGMATEIGRSIKESSAVVANALELAKEKFMLSTQRERFWGPIEQSLARPV